MADIEIRDNKLFVNGLELDPNPRISSTGKSRLLATVTTKIRDENGEEVKVQVTAYKKA